MLGYLELDDDDYVSDFDTKAEEIPGAYIIQREIRKAQSGKDFFINDDDTGKPIRYSGVSWDDFVYYYKIWENYNYFGYPYGMDWTEARTWFNEFLKSFDKVKEQCNVLIEKRMSKKGNMTGGD